MSGFWDLLARRLMMWSFGTFALLLLIEIVG